MSPDPETSKVAYAERYRVYRNPHGRQWNVVRGYAYICYSTSWEAALSAAVRSADADRKAAQRACGGRWE